MVGTGRFELPTPRTASVWFAVSIRSLQPVGYGRKTILPEGGLGCHVTFVGTGYLFRSRVSNLLGKCDVALLNRHIVTTRLKQPALTHCFKLIHR